MKNRRWTTEEDNVVKELYSSESNKLIAIIVRRSEDSVRKRGKFLNVSKSNERLLQSRLENLQKAGWYRR